jgi:hypothetical protein
MDTTAITLIFIVGKYLIKNVVGPLLVVDVDNTTSLQKVSADSSSV